MDLERQCSFYIMYCMDYYNSKLLGYIQFNTDMFGARGKIEIYLPEV